MSYLVENLIESIKTRTFAPISQNTLENSDLVTIANDEMLLRLVRDIKRVREDFFETEKNVTLTSGIKRYAIPKRAVGTAVNFIYWTDAGGREYFLDRVDSSRKNEWQGVTGPPIGFYFQGDEAVLVPTPNVSGTLTFVFDARPNTLILSDDATKLTTVSTGATTTTFTVDVNLTASLSAGSKIDIISAAAPFMLWAEDIAIQSISATEIVVNNSDIQDAVGSIEPQVGDYICATGFSNIPMLPIEFHAVLAQMCAVRVLSSLGDEGKKKSAKEDLAELRAEAMDLIANRAESAPKFVRNNRGLSSVFK